MKHITTTFFFIAASLFAGLLGLSREASAGTWGLQAHIHSNHFADRAHEDWTESTDGFAVRYEWDEVWAAQAGHYRNEFSVRSYNFFTNYAGIDWTPWRVGPMHFGGYGRLTSGYDAHVLAPNPGDMAHPSTVVAARGQGLLPEAGLVARLDVRNFNLIVRLRPDSPGMVPSALMTEIGWSFR